MKIEKSFGTVLIDEEDAHLICFGKHLMINKGLLYFRDKRKKIIFAVHRKVAGAPKNKDVDHINGNTLDNRKSNLRVCSRSQNNYNRGPKKNNKSGYKGVVFKSDHWREKPWVAMIKTPGKYLHIGSFKTAEEAAMAYDAAALKYAGDFAWLNFPEFFPGRPQNNKFGLE